MEKNPRSLKRLKKFHTKPSILITAGPTREPLDPVRFLSNYSTGTIGWELAKEAVRRKYRVILISGHTELVPPKGLTRFIRVETARQMKKAVERHYTKADIVFMAAAVSDFRPARMARHKVKKEAAGKIVTVRLKKNPDILLGLGRKKGKRVLVGFALETDNSLHNARRKLTKKNLDILVMNELSKKQVPFGGGLHTYVVLDTSGKAQTLPRINKKFFSNILLDKAESL